MKLEKIIDPELRLLIARSIGQTASTTNHMERADAVWKVIIDFYEGKK